MSKEEKPKSEEKAKASRVYSDVLDVIKNPHHAAALKLLTENPPQPGENVYLSPRVSIVGDGLRFEPILIVDQGLGRNIGGIFRTSDANEIALLERLCAEYSGNYLKVAGE
jgi:hypothetical protein